MRHVNELVLVLSLSFEPIHDCNGGHTIANEISTYSIGLQHCDSLVFLLVAVVYGDYSSSGRSLQFLEDYINKEVLPAFGDCECTSAVTGLQSLLYK